MSKRDYYQEITDRVVAALESGVKPWAGVLIRRGGPARNFLTGKPYRGINVITTAISAMEQGFGSNWWLTLKQANHLGGKVKAGSKGTPIYFWNWIERETEGVDGRPKVEKVAFLKLYYAFNADQIEGIEFGEEKPRAEVETIEAAEAILAGMREKPAVEVGGLQPCYVPALDLIRMPEQSEFRSDAQYYKTMFHEIGHWTGAEKRLARPGIVNASRENREQYAREELVAEMTAAFLAAAAGLPEVAGVQESASYIGMYLELLKGDKRAMVTAASQAQKAADLVLGVSVAGAEQLDRAEAG